MKIESINIAQPVNIEYQDQVVETGIYKNPISNKATVTKLGLTGDHIVDTTVHGGEDQAVYLYSQDDNEWWSKRLNREITPGTFGENLTISSFSTETLKIGDRLKIGEVLLEITAPRTPCFKLAEKMGDSNFIKLFVEALRPGAYARVLHVGDIYIGDDVTVIETEKDYALINDVFIEWHSPNKSSETLNKALLSPMSNYHRRIIQEWLN